MATVPMIVEATPEPDCEGVPVFLGHARRKRVNHAGAKPLPMTRDSGLGIRLDAALELKAIVTPGFEGSKRYDSEEALRHPRKRLLPVLLADASRSDSRGFPGRVGLARVRACSRWKTAYRPIPPRTAD